MAPGRDRIVCGEARDRKLGHHRTVDGGSLRAGKLQAGIAASQGQPRERRYGWDDRPAITGVSETELASNPGTIVERDVSTATGEAGGNPQAGWRGAKAWHPDGAGSVHPASGDASTARQVGPDIFQSQLRFRPGRSAHQAVDAAQQYMAAGHRWVVDLDLEKFFDRVNHDKLMAKIAERVSDWRLLKLIRAFLRAGVMEGGLVSPGDEGTPQGGPLSPLLSNIVLDEFDQELERRGLRFARYADDCNVYVRSRRAGERVMASITRFITTKLKLKVNEQKSAVARPWERKFLGFSFTAGREPKRRIAPKAVLRFKEKVRELTRRTRGVKVERMAEELGRYLRGWVGYFGHSQTPSVLEELERWLRRRLRSAIWKQWKREGYGLLNCESGASARNSPRQRRAAAMARGGWRTVLHSRTHCPMSISTRSGFRD